MKQIISHCGDGVPLFINGKPKVEIKEYSEVNQCPTCGEVFESIYAFDFHRTGEFNKNRRCCTLDEMTTKGMIKNRFNRWVSKASSYSYRDTNDLNN
jgi:hypothetical protein